MSQENPEFPAIRFTHSDESLSYGQLVSEVERWCGFLKDLRLEAGERVMLILPPGPEFIAATLAVIGAQGIAVPMNGLLTPFEFEQLTRSAKSIGIITTNKIASSYHASLLGAINMRFVATVDGPFELDHGRSGLKFAAFNSSTQKRVELSEPKVDDTVTCHYTYKGIGYPLGVEHSYGAYNQLLKDTAIGLQAKDGGLHLLGLPLYPVYGLSICVFLPLSLGCTLMLGGKEARVDLIKTLARHKVDIACVVPEILGQMALTVMNQGAELTKLLRHQPLLVSGGSFLSPVLGDMIKGNLDVKLVQGYGTTETLPCLLETGGSLRSGSIGRPLGANQVKIMNGQGQALSPGRIGEVWVKGPYNCKAFVDKPRESVQFFHEGWFRSGDLGSLDEEGNVYFEGRRQNFVKVQSQMVDLTELENVALRHPAIARAKTLVEVDDQFQTRLTLFVVVKRIGAIDEKAIQKFLRAHLSPHKVPKKINIYRSNRSTESGWQAV